MYKQTSTDSLSSGSSILLSLTLHVFLVFILLGFSFFQSKKEKSEPLTVKLLQPQNPVAPKPEPVAPKPEPVAPKPEPVAPKPEPVPKISADALPLPKPIPKAAPVPPKTRADSIRERLQSAPVKSAPPGPRPLPPAPAVSASSVKERLLADVRTSASAVSTAPAASATAVAEREAIRYADLIVNPILTPIWAQLGPTKGELGGDMPQPAEIAFIVLADGTITMLRVSQRSNHPAMNRAIERLLAAWRSQKLPGLKESGVESGKLSITITLQAKP